MNKKLKKQLLDMINTLYEAHREIDRIISEDNLEQAIPIMGDCQNAASKIIDILGEDESLFAPAIEQLEGYYKLLYLLSTDSLNDNDISINGTLDSHLQKAESSLKSLTISVKKALFIAYYFPPLGGSGVYRSIKFVKYLPLYGWESTVISAEKPPVGWNYSDDSLTNEIPDSTTVIRIPDKIGRHESVTLDSKSVNNIYGFLRDILCTDKQTTEVITNLIKSNDGIKKILAFPDNSLAWGYEVSQYIETHLNLTDYDVVYTTSGPYSAHIIGAYLKKKYGISWIADYRDQWTANPLLENNNKGLFYKLLLRLEKNLLAIASHNICVAPRAKKDYVSRLKVNLEKISVITNGYDEDDFSELNEPAKRGSHFTITFSGLLYAGSQTLLPVVTALSDLCTENAIDRKKICLQVIGAVDKKNMKLVNDTGLKDIFVFKGYLPHRDTLKNNLRSDVLLIVIGDTDANQSWIPGKLFDYLRSNRPILALAPKTGDAADILAGTGRGITFRFNDINEIKAFILKEYQKWEANSPFDKLELNRIECYERKKLTKDLVDIFERNIWKENRYEDFSAEVYDKNYKNSIAAKHPYSLHYTKSNYYGSWKTAMKFLFFLDRNISILEIGCGPGQFASMLYDNGFINYTGFDFSKDGIALAKKNNPKIADRFYIDDAFTTVLLDKRYDLVICFEVLEHIRNDMALLDRIVSGTRVLLSVPNFNDPNHVRYFESDDEVRSRYENAVKIYDIHTSIIHEPYRLYYIIGEKK